MNRCSKTSKLYRIRQAITAPTRKDKLATAQMMNRAEDEASRAIVGIRGQYGTKGIRKLANLLGA